MSEVYLYNTTRIASTEDPLLTILLELMKSLSRAHLGQAASVLVSTVEHCRIV
jgi:hypothetical protein